MLCTSTLNDKFERISLENVDELFHETDLAGLADFLRKIFEFEITLKKKVYYEDRGQKVVAV